MVYRPVMVFTAPSFLPVEFQQLLNDAQQGGGGGSGDAPATVPQLNAAIATLQAQIDAMQGQIDTLQSQVEALEEAASS